MKQNFENKIQNVNPATDAHHTNATDFEMDIYNELADQTTSKVNIVSQIHMQLSQIEEALAKRTYLAKEISPYIIK